MRRDIPVTTPTRILDDLKPTIPSREHRRAVRQAEVLGYPLGPDLVSDHTRSELEHEFLRICRRHRIPAPEVNVRVGPFLVDFLWREQWLIAETDGYRYHRGRAAFEDDHRRDIELRRLGFEVVRFTYRQVSKDVETVTSTLRTLLPAAVRR